MKELDVEQASNLTAGPQSLEQRIARAIETWSAQLMDVGGRNNLLYYRDLRTSTLDLAGGRPPVVESLLLGKPVRMSAMFPAVDDRKEAVRRIRSIHGKAREHFEERGISTLYLACGIATWTNPRTSTLPAAPVLMRPAQLTPRGAAEDDFELVLTGEMGLNPVLLHLLETDFSRPIPQDALLDRLDGVIDTTWELDETYAWLNQEARQVPGFGVTPRIVLGNFLYAKLPMVEDLKGASAQLAAHDIVGAIVGDPSARDRLRERYDGIHVDISLPDTTLPEDEFLVLDTDSSQSLAINRVIAGSDLIIKGPPGTGKSQTIANLIASLLGRGEKVLFVAEKRAAIDAVFKRLEQVGLSDLLLDVHGGTATRREVAASLGKAMDAMARAPRATIDDTYAELVAARDRLRAHAEGMHSVREPWGLSLHEAIEQLTGLQGANRTDLRFRGKILDRLSSKRFPEALTRVRDFETLEGMNSHLSPWASAPIDSASDARLVFERVEDLREGLLPAIRGRFEAAALETRRPTPSTRDETDRLLGDWTEARAVLDCFASEIFQEDLEGLATALEPARSSLTRTFALLFSSEYRHARRILRSVAHDNRTADSVLLALSRRALILRGRWRADGSTSEPSVPNDLQALEAGLKQLRVAAEELSISAGVPDLAVASDAEMATTLDALLADRGSLLRLPEVRRLTVEIKRDGVWPFVEDARESTIRATNLTDRIRWAWLQSIIERAEFADEKLGRFDGKVHGSTVKAFSDLDHRHLRRTAGRLRRAVAEQSVRDRSRYRDEEQMLRHQASLKRRHLPLRQLFQHAPHALLAVKPCWAMSPLMVSQVLPADRAYFDVVIFDEASQVTPADAIPSIMRARRLVVAGDDRQLPPTSFFMTAQQEDESRTESQLLELDLTHGFESILDSLAPVLPITALDWHYRSQDERLIAFSNEAFYESRLVTFPGVSGRGSVSHVLVPFVTGSGQQESANAEVQTVVRLVLKHAEEHPAESLGVIAMGITHASRVDDALREALRARPELDAFFDETRDERFFVKNLERVQGDERDAIILTVGYGKTDDGRMVYRFGPINYDGGERRLNVAVTRARRRMTIVSSFSAADMDSNRLTRKGPQLLRDYLAYAAAAGEGSRAASDLASRPEISTAIVNELAERGFKAKARLGSSEHWIDVGVTHPDGGDRYLLAVETDGQVYGRTPTTRDRDRLRAEQLQRLGWAHHRVWSLDWLHDRHRLIDEIARSVALAVARESRPAGDDHLDRAAPSDGVPEAAVRGPIPSLGYYDKIDDIYPSRLRDFITWQESDGLLRTEDELIVEAVELLGFQRRGSRIEAALKRAIEDSRSRRSRA